MTSDPLPENLKRLRQDRGMTQQQLASRIGVREKDISRWELGRNMPDLSTIRKLAYTLSVQVDVLAPPLDPAAEIDAAVKRAHRGTQR